MNRIWDWADFVNVICETDGERRSTEWRGLRDGVEDANIVLYAAMRRRRMDPFRFFRRSK